jgi:hypothetical protein
MNTIKFSERVDFTYFAGAGMCLLFFIISMNFYSGDGLPIGFSLACLGAYTGVIVRGIIDKDSWGRTQKKIRMSALLGFTSVFVIFFIESLLLLAESFDMSMDKIILFIIFGGIGIVILYLILYLRWFRNLKIETTPKTLKNAIATKTRRH